MPLLHLLHHWEQFCSCSSFVKLIKPFRPTQQPLSYIITILSSQLQFPKWKCLPPVVMVVQHHISFFFEALGPTPQTYYSQHSNTKTEHASSVAHFSGTSTSTPPLPPVTFLMSHKYPSASFCLQNHSYLPKKLFILSTQLPATISIAPVESFQYKFEGS